MSDKIIHINKLTRFALFLMLSLTASLLSLAFVSAQFANDAKEGLDTTTGTSGGDVSNLLQAIVNTLLFLVGAASVIMIIIGGIRFIVSNGDPQGATNARNTVLYAVIGVIVSVVAYGIVSFVIASIESGTPPPAEPTPVETTSGQTLE